MNFEQTIKPGDVFRFGQTLLGWAYGQFLISRTIQYVVIFEPVFKDPAISSLDDAIRSPVLLAGWTTDARVQSGSWEIVGNTPDRPMLLFPEYKVEISGKIWVIDVEGKRLREANLMENAALKYKSSHSPIAYEKAFWAFHAGEWQGRFDDLRAKTDDC